MEQEEEEEQDQLGFRVLIEWESATTKKTRI